MVIEQSKDKTGQIIMVGLHQRPDITNSKYPIGYPRESNHGHRVPKYTFLSTRP